jgi:hypothetical protein
MDITILDALRNVLALAKEHAVTGEDNDSVKLLGLLLTGSNAESGIKGFILNDQDLLNGETVSFAPIADTNWDLLKSIEEVAIDMRTGDRKQAIREHLGQDEQGEYHKVIEITFTSKI